MLLWLCGSPASPEERFQEFWEKVRRAVGPEGRVFFIDSLRTEQASAVDHELHDQGEETMLRRLADGREYEIVKRFHEPNSCNDDSPTSAGRSRSTRRPHSSFTGRANSFEP